MKFGAKLPALAATLLVMGAALAQPSPALPGADLSDEEAAALPAGELLARARGYLPGMEQGYEDVRVQTEKARKDKDVVKTLCLNDKLGQIDLAMRTAVDRIDGLEGALKQNDIERARHQFTVVRVLRERVSALVSEAQQCIGEETGFVGDTDVTLEIDPSIPETDPSEFPEDKYVSLPPVLSSPTL